MTLEAAIKAKFATVLTASDVNEKMHIAVVDGSGAPVGNISLEEVEKIMV